jgi:hypothetical protein
MKISTTWRMYFLAILVFLTTGCSAEVDATFGRSRSTSINGTAVFARLFRERGHEVRTAVRLSDELLAWADVIVRFARAPGPPPRDEADWYVRWLAAMRGRRLVYVPRDYDALEEYWALALRQLPEDSAPRLRERVQEAGSAVRDWTTHLPPAAKKPASAHDWFALKSAGKATVCKALSGEWAEGIDPAAAALTRHQTFKVDAERVLLAGDGQPLVITWTRINGSRVLAAAGGPFLLNLPLTVPARWPLAERTLRWAEGTDDDEQDGKNESKRRVAFVEGPDVVSGPAGLPSPFDLLAVAPFGWVAAQVFILALAACLARTPRLGRPRPEEPSGADRPVAHAEALGALLARTGQASEAWSILETYRRWRTGPRSPGSGPRGPSSML